MTLAALELSREFKSNMLGRTRGLVGAQIGLSDPAVVEIFGAAGFDWVLIDCEHTPRDLPGVLAMVRAARLWPMVPFVRLNKSESDWLPILLDHGVTAIVAPFIESAAEAERLVAACRYPPRGTRSWGALRASNFGQDVDEYFASWSDALIVVAILESRAGIENCRDVLSVDGIDGALIGPMDLSLSLGAFKDFSSRAYTEAVERARETAADLGKGFGSSAYDPTVSRESIGVTDSLLLVAGDEPLLLKAASGVRKAFGAGDLDA